MSAAWVGSKSAISQVLGEAFARLPPEVRAVHSGATLVLSGRADADLGAGIAKILICAAFGLPRQGHGQPVTVAFSTDAGGVDHWQRNFAGRRYSSTLRAGTGRHANRLVERQGIVTSIFALTGESDRLEFRLTGFALFGLPLPRWLVPRCLAIESARGGNFTFDIGVDLPVVGRLIQYKGELVLAGTIK